MCYCRKELGHLGDGAGLSAILFVCSFADPPLFPSLFASVLKFTVFLVMYCMHSNKLAGVRYVNCVQFFT